MKIDELDAEEIVRLTSGYLIKLPSGRVLTLSKQGLWIAQEKRLLSEALIAPEDLPGLRELLSKEVRENGNRDSDEEG